MRRTVIFILGCLVTLVAMSWPSGESFSSVEHRSPFRYSGDGVLPLYNTFTRQFETITYRRADGTYDDKALAEIDQILACHSNNEQLPISLKLIELVDHLQDHFGAEQIDVISGYRSPDYNAKLKRRIHRVARYSMHMRGRAMDLKLAGIDSRLLRNYAIALQAGGVGYYGRQRFIHIDTGPVRKW